MADLNKFQRSKEKIMEAINHLMYKPAGDGETNSRIANLERSVKIIDSKIEDIKRKKLI